MDTIKNVYSVIAKNKNKENSEVLFGQTNIVFDSGTERNIEFAGPAEILCTSFAACTLKNVSRFSKILPFQYDYAEITVSAERQDNPPRIVKLNYELRLKTIEDNHRIELLHTNIKKFGTIFNTLTQAFNVEGSIKKIIE